MTATLRIFAAPELAESADTTRPRRRPAAGRDVDAFANSMDNEAVYGKKVFEYPLAQAVADGRAADYRIVVPTLTDTDLRRRLNLPSPSSAPAASRSGDDNEGVSALRTTALHLSVLRAMTEHGLKKVLVYFNLVSDARRFARELPHTLRLLARTDPGLVPDITPKLFFAHGEHTPAQRADTFTAFAAADCAILANSRLIAEGVDIPSVDAIVFADPTRSVIRCVQALGRALRLDVSGKTASLIVPVYVPPGADGENILGTPYEPVWAIACALASHDHHILERLPDKANRLPKETSDVIQRRWHFDFTVHPERIARAMDLASFDPRDPAVSRSRRLGATTPSSTQRSATPSSPSAGQTQQPSTTPPTRSPTPWTSARPGSTAPTSPNGSNRAARRKTPGTTLSSNCAPRPPRSKTTLGWTPGRPSTPSSPPTAPPAPSAPWQATPARVWPCWSSPRSKTASCASRPSWRNYGAPPRKQTSTVPAASMPPPLAPCLARSRPQPSARRAPPAPPPPTTAAMTTTPAEQRLHACNAWHPPCSSSSKTKP
ncbi:helicase-related protein [Streptomyces luteogriseus]|uniref:helicase-related protein n=1 Tax=Streptomyces luteogriseus TaxID=68233 RepID=UPI0037A4D825